MKWAMVVLALGAMATGSQIVVLRAQQAPLPPAPPPVPTVTNVALPAPAMTNMALVQKIQFAMPIHDFGRIKVNEPAKCNFIFTNTGQAMLEITAVNPGCGCTTAGEWTRKVEPGKTGNIPIQFNGVGAPGPFGKAMSVTCNDPAQPTVSLQIKGVLWKPIEVNPQYAVFNVTAESVSNATSIVRIINNEETPLTFSAPECNNPYFTAVVKTNVPGKEFEVTIRPVPPLPGNNTGGAFTLKTSSSNAPIIQINTAAMMMPTLALNPPSIVLPPPPNTNNVRPVIYVRNNGTSPFRLSDPVVNAKGVDVQIKEIEPGRYASLTLTFPPEFTITPGEKIHLNVKTGLAHSPNFEVPVFQRPRIVN